MVATARAFGPAGTRSVPTVHCTRALSLSFARPPIQRYPMHPNPHALTHPSTHSARLHDPRRHTHSRSTNHHAPSLTNRALYDACKRTNTQICNGTLIHTFSLTHAGTKSAGSEAAAVMVAPARAFGPTGARSVLPNYAHVYVELLRQRRAHCEREAGFSLIGPTIWARTYKTSVGRLYDFCGEHAQLCIVGVVATSAFYFELDMHLCRNADLCCI